MLRTWRPALRLDCLCSCFLSAFAEGCIRVCQGHGRTALGTASLWHCFALLLGSGCVLESSGARRDCFAECLAHRSVPKASQFASTGDLGRVFLHLFLLTLVLERFDRRLQSVLWRCSFLGILRGISNNFYRLESRE